MFPICSHSVFRYSLQPFWIKCAGNKSSWPQPHDFLFKFFISFWSLKSHNDNFQYYFMDKIPVLNGWHLFIAIWRQFVKIETSNCNDILIVAVLQVFDIEMIIWNSKLNSCSRFKKNKNFFSFVALFSICSISVVE